MNKNVSKDIASIPIDFTIIKSMKSIMVTPNIDKEKAFDENFVSITERESFMKRFRGTLGKNLNKTYYE